ncbi:attachment protein [Tioman virus]|uniref:Attachment protein n=1 Tax=Tioman virus TaxID=162013 RepID=Q8JVA7_9MONO|nr:attachment protein [Tioman virus]AAM82287.1 attachment protein [Tioman virus]
MWATSESKAPIPANSTLNLVDVPLDEPQTITKHRKQKRTGRLVFRLLSLVLSLMTVILVLVILASWSQKINACATKEGFNSLDLQISGLVKSINSLITEVNQISITTAINLPIKLSDFGKSIVDQVTQMIRQCNAVCKGPGEKPGIQNIRINIPNNFSTYLELNNTVKSIELQRRPALLARPNPIPKSCSRFPSYSVNFGIHCFAHAITDQSCELSDKTYYRLAIGISDKNLSDPSDVKYIGEAFTPMGLQARGCSVISSIYGCYLLCSKSNQGYEADFQTQGFHQMYILFLSRDLKTTLFNDMISSTTVVWNGLYPGEGAGIWHMGYLIFPLWGGIKIGTPASTSILNSTLDLPLVGPSCKSTLEENNLINKDVLFSPYFGESVMVFGFLSCYMLSNVPTHCQVEVLNSSVLGFGSRSQLMDLKGIVYLYIQSAGWYSYTQLFRLSLQSRGYKLTVKQIRRIPISSTTRPGTAPCDVVHNCPYTCATGLFQAPWIVNGDSILDRDVRNLVFVQAWSGNFNTFQKGLISICNQYTCPLTTLLDNDNSIMRSTTTYCYPSLSEYNLQCQSFIEWGGPVGNPIGILEVHYIIKFK